MSGFLSRETNFRYNNESTLAGRTIRDTGSGIDMTGPAISRGRPCARRATRPKDKSRNDNKPIFKIQIFMTLVL